MKIAILGAGGFVGARAVEYFTLEEKAEVRCVVRRYASLARSSRFATDWRIADATDCKQLAESFKGCDFVLHAISGNDEEIAQCAHPAYAAAEQAGIKKLVFISSAAIYGPNPAADTDENTQLSRKHLNGYASSKLQAETQFRKLGARGKVDVVVLRPSIVIGPRSYWVLEVAKQLHSGTAPLAGGGSGICNSVYVDNLLDAVLLACTTKVDKSEVFLIGDDDCVTWHEYYKQLATLLKIRTESICSISPESTSTFDRWKTFLRALRASAPVKAASLLTPVFLHDSLRRALSLQRWTPSPWIVPENSTHIPHLRPEIAALHRSQWRLSNAKARRLLGYKPTVTLSEGWQRSVDWLRYASLSE